MAFPKQLLISYVEGLELAPFDNGVSAGAKDALDQDAASVVASLAVVFPEGLSRKLVADIQNSMLFAQFAANAKYNKTDQAKQWYNLYKDVLENIGWVAHNFTWNDVKDAGTYVSVDQLLFELAAAYLSPVDLKLLNGLVDALKKATNGEALKLYDRSTVKNNKANFQVAVGGESGGSAVLKIGSHIYSIQSNIIHVLFATFGSQSVTFEYNSQNMSLNDGVYSKVRDLIIERLGDHAVSYVLDVDISPGL